MSESSTRNGTSAIRRRQAGLCFAVLAGQFITVIMLAASMAPGYDAAAAAISDLGVIPETAAVFNASLIATGALNTLGAVILFTADRRRTALVVATIAGIGAIGAGTVTLATPGIHGLFALLAFIFFNLEVLGGAIAMRGALRAIGLGLGLLGLAYVVVMLVGDSGVPQAFGAIGHGGTERMIVYPPMLWLLVYGGALLATEDEP